MTVMKSRFLVQKVVVFVVSLLFASLAMAQLQPRPCDGSPQTFNLAIRAVNNVPTEVRLGPNSGDNLFVCPGDTVAWIFQGRGFSIIFPSGTPFNVSELTTPAGAGRVSAQVTNSNAANYKYDITLEGGGTLDPRIIVAN